MVLLGALRLPEYLEEEPGLFLELLHLLAPLVEEQEQVLVLVLLPLLEHLAEGLEEQGLSLAALRQLVARPAVVVAELDLLLAVLHQLELPAGALVLDLLPVEVPYQLEYPVGDLAEAQEVYQPPAHMSLYNHVRYDYATLQLLENLC